MSVFGIKSNKCKQEVVPASQVFDVVYPVGSIYMSANNVNPSTLFGGTWVQISGKFLLASSSGRAAGTTGGAETVSYTPAGTVGNHTLTASEMPAHTHTYAKSAATSGSTTLTADQIPSHNHSYNAPQANTGSTTLTASQIPAHTHTYARSASSTNNHTLTEAQIPSHKHGFTTWITKGNASTKTIASGSAMGINPPDSFETQATGGGQGHNHGITFSNTATSSIGSGGAHSHTMPTSSASTGNKGGGGGHTHSISTSSTATGSTGSGGAHNHGFTGTQASINKMPPYLVVNVWQRTA